MLLYNTSYFPDKELETVFSEWMKNTLIPLLEETKTFTENYFCKVMTEKADESTYSLLLLFKNKAQFDDYLTQVEPRIKLLVFQQFYRRCKKIKTRYN